MSECLTSGRLRTAWGNNSWCRLAAIVNKNDLSSRNVGCPAVKTDTVGLIGCKSLPATSLHVASIPNVQHQSYCSMGSLAVVAWTRHRIWKSAFALSSARKWTPSSCIFCSDAKVSRLTWGITRKICPSQHTSTATGLPIQRQGPPRVLSKVITSGSEDTAKQGMFCTHLRQSVDAQLLLYIIWRHKAFGFVVLWPLIVILAVIGPRGCSSVIASSTSCVQNVKFWGEVEPMMVVSWLKMHGSRLRSYSVSSSELLYLSSRLRWFTRRIPNGNHISNPALQRWLKVVSASGIIWTAFCHPKNQQVWRLTGWTLPGCWIDMVNLGAHIVWVSHNRH